MHKRNIKIMSLIKNLKESEGFSGVVYQDHLGFDTIGYGTKLSINEEEAELLLKHRLEKKIQALVYNKPFVERLSEDVQEALYEMAYQLGVAGLLKFKKMWLALEKDDYALASKEALDSRWAKQTPNRAKRIADVVGRG